MLSQLKQSIKFLKVMLFCGLKLVRELLNIFASECLIFSICLSSFSKCKKNFHFYVSMLVTWYKPYTMAATNMSMLMDEPCISSPDSLYFGLPRRLQI